MAPTPAVPAVPSPSFSEIRQMLNNEAQGIEAVPASTEAPVAEPAPPATETATAADVETAPATEPEVQTEDPQRDEAGKFVKKASDDLPTGVQKRIAKEIGRATEARREAESLRDAAAQRLKDIESQVTQPVKTATSASQPPKMDDFETYDQYTAALTRHEAKNAVEEILGAERAKADKAKADTHQATLRTEWQKSEAEARQQYTDYDETVADIDWPQSPAIEAVSSYIMEAQNAGLLYHLQKNTEDVLRIAAMSPMRAIAELGKIEATLVKPAKAPVKATVQTPPATARTLPKPPAVVNSAAPVPQGIDLEKADMRAFRAEMIRLGHHKPRAA